MESSLATSPSATDISDISLSSIPRSRSVESFFDFQYEKLALMDQLHLKEQDATIAAGTYVHNSNMEFIFNTNDV